MRRCLVAVITATACACSSDGSSGTLSTADAAVSARDASVQSDASAPQTSDEASAGKGGSDPEPSAGRAAADAGIRPAPRDAAIADAAVSDEDDAATSPRDAATDEDAGPPPETCTGANRLDTYVSDPKLCVYVFAEGLGAARQLAFASNGDLFVSNAGKLTVLWDGDGDGHAGESERAQFASASGLNHGVAFSPDGAFVYASSSTTVYRWAYNKGQRSANGEPQIVVDSIPFGGHSTRTLAFDSKGRLYVSVGSATNVDESAQDLELRSQIRRFTLPVELPGEGLRYTSGEVIATGMRNEAGIYIDANDRLWGVENGRDNLHREDLGGDIHDDNPGEKINFVDGTGARSYGYPYCFAEHTLPTGGGRGTLWADTSLSSELRKTDAYCRDATQVHPPAYVMPAHWAPLGIIQYTGRALPYSGDLLIGSHGSWNRAPATGRVIARAHLHNGAVTDLTVLVGGKNEAGELEQGYWDVRPVDVRQGPDDAVYVSDDLGGRVLKIGYAR